MRKTGMLLVLLLVGAACFGESLFAPYHGPRHLVGGHILPVGLYSYAATRDDGGKNLFGGGFNEIGMSYEYRPWSILGLEAYFDFKGYRFDGYRSDPNPFVSVWGLPNIKAGGGAVIHVPLDRSRLDLSAASGVEYAHYIADEVNSFPGIGLTARLRGTWFASPLFGLGLTAAAHYSTHAGGPYEEDPDTIRLPFELAEMSVGIQGYLRF